MTDRSLSGDENDSSVFKLSSNSSLNHSGSDNNKLPLTNRLHRFSDADKFIKRVHKKSMEEIKNDDSALTKKKINFKEESLNKKSFHKNSEKKKFKKKNEKNFDLQNIKFFIFLNFYIVNYYLIKQMYSNLYIENYFSDFSKLNLLKIFTILFIFNIGNIICLSFIIYFFRNIQSKYFQEICYLLVLNSACYAIAYISLYLLMNKILTYHFNFFIFFPQIFIIIFLTFFRKFSVFFKICLIFLLSEWIQNSMIIANIYLAKFKWNFVLIIYEIWSCLFFLLSFLLIIYLLLSLIFFWVKKKIIIKHIFLCSIYLISTINIFYIIWYGFYYYYCLESIKEILNDLDISDKAISFSNINTSGLNSIFNKVKFLQYFTLILFNVIFICVEIVSIIFEKKEKRKEGIIMLNDLLNINFEQFTQKILKQNSIYYDEEEESEEEESPFIKVETRRTKCLTCREKFNEIIFNPCGHSGFCQDCIRIYLKHSKICPFCNSPFGKIYVVYFDVEKNLFVSQDCINISN